MKSATAGKSRHGSWKRKPYLSVLSDLLAVNKKTNNNNKK